MILWRGWKLRLHDEEVCQLRLILSVWKKFVEAVDTVVRVVGDVVVIASVLLGA